MVTNNSATQSRIEALPYRRVLPRLYRLLLSATRLRGSYTLAKFHKRFFGGEEQVVIPHGGSLIIPDDFHYFGFVAGVHEPHVAKIIQESIRPGDVCFDVGANIGYFSMMMAQATGTTGKVFSFEPVPTTFAFLSLNSFLAARRDLQINAQQAAVSAEVGRLVIEYQSGSTQNQVRTVRGEDELESDYVPSITLDQFFQEKAITGRVSLVKVDVEGHELAVVKGALPILQSGQIARMIIEITPGEDTIEIENLLSSCRSFTECWIDGHWKSINIKNLDYRTDVLVSFDSPH